MLTIITNGKILLPSGWIENHAIAIDNGEIKDIYPLCTPHCDTPDAEIIDAHGTYIIPGGIDLHVHGGGGHDFMECNEKAFRRAIAAHQQHGTTAIYPTLGAASAEMMHEAATITERLMAEADSPVMGLHLEGPYLNPTMAGGQIPEYIRQPDVKEYIALIEQHPCIKRWDTSPEEEGAIEFGKYASKRGIIVGLAHTEANYNQVEAAYKAGYTHATHFYNAMTGVHKVREFKSEGTIESIYLMDDMSVEVIADGIHVPPAILRLVHKIKGVERTCLVTDAMACSAGDDSHIFDPRVIIEDGVCKLADRSALAGSIATMDRLWRTMVEAGIDLADAVRMSSQTPARIMGIYDRKGSLERGKDADIVLLNCNLEVERVMCMGRWVK